MLSIPSEDQRIEVLEQVTTPRGELVLRARHHLPPGRQSRTVYELISNGVFLMDSEEISTERALATQGLAPLAGRAGLRVLVGGLGLGYTLEATLGVEEVSEAVVVELEPALVRWVSGPLKHLSGDALGDARVRVVVADVVTFLERNPDPFHAILLDVDNGPEFIVHEENQWLYSIDGLERTRRNLAPGGALTIWSSERSPVLRDRMESLFSRVDEVSLQARRGNHLFNYFLYQGIQAGADH